MDCASLRLLRISLEMETMAGSCVTGWSLDVGSPHVVEGMLLREHAKDLHADCSSCSYAEAVVG